MSTKRPDLTADRTHIREEIEIALTYNASPLMTSEDVVDVVRGAVYDSRDYGGDGDDLAAIVLLASGQYAALEGYADYTGWDCGSGCDVTLHDSAEAAWLNGLTADARALVERAETATATTTEETP